MLAFRELECKFSLPVFIGVDIVRTFRPSRVRRSTVPASPAAESMIGELLRHRLGLGPGLTPEADDELAGHLLVAAATGAPVPELEPQLHRTTALSASLLRAAAQGYAVLIARSGRPLTG